eukprot:541264-Alexandrium_andersonii.AAC.1
MSASLVGSEMCIRDRSDADGWHSGTWAHPRGSRPSPGGRGAAVAGDCDCLLYTSDAADDM